MYAAPQQDSYAAVRTWNHCMRMLSCQCTAVEECNLHWHCCLFIVQDQSIPSTRLNSCVVPFDAGHGWVRSAAAWAARLRTGARRYGQGTRAQLEIHISACCVFLASERAERHEDHQNSRQVESAHNLQHTCWPDGASKPHHRCCIFFEKRIMPICCASSIQMPTSYASKSFEEKLGLI